MTWWMLAAGIILVTTVSFDVLATTVSSSTRAGPVATVVNQGLWRLITGVSRTDDAVPLRMAGPLIVSATVAAWLLLLWLGWTLVFAADPQAVVASATDEPVGFRSRLLFTAYTVFTLGYGNYLPTSGWELPSALAVVNGLSLATLAITYLIPVVTAVTDRRRQAAWISTAGLSAEEIVETFHDANGFGALDQVLPQLTSQVLMTGQRHLSYPVIHHYRGSQRAAAFPPSVAAFDDAVTLLTVAVTGRQTPNAPLTSMWRAAVDQLLADARIPKDVSAEVPPAPSTEVLDRLGVEHLGADAYRRALEHEDERRRRLHHFVRSTRWQWPAAPASE